MKSKPLSESSMAKLWRQAVLIKCKHRCYLCGVYGDENLECHHIIKRRYKSTRWYWKNGTSLCHACHSAVETKSAVRRELENNWQYMDELDEMNMTDYKTMLSEKGYTHNEYYNLIADVLKRVNNGE